MTLPTTLDRMQRYIYTWEQAGDRRTIFLKCYLLMTTNMLRAVEAQRFQDCLWVERLVHHFADYYFRALETYDHERPELPQVWRVAFDLAREPTTTAIQNLLMGVNAHINYDLTLALADLLAPEWAALTPEQRERRYADHCMVNTVIGETIDLVQDRVLEHYAQVMNFVDIVLGPLDEWWTAQLIRNWRTDVWRHAVALIESPDPAARAVFVQRLDSLAFGRIRLLIEGGQVGARVFGYPLRWLHRLRML